jgi:GAF domain-containing protein
LRPVFNATLCTLAANVLSRLDCIRDFMLPSNTNYLVQNYEASITLSNFIVAISEAKTKQEIYASLAAHLPELVSADRYSVALLSPEGNALEIFSLHGSEGVLPIGKSLPIEKTYVGKAVKEKSTLLNILTPESGLLDTRLLLEQGLKSCINAPLIVGEKVIGTVNIGSASNQLYDANSVELMNLVATLASTYLQRQQLLEQSQELMLGYRRYSEQLEVLNRCVSKLSTAKDESQIFNIIEKSITNLVPSKRISYVTPNKDHSEFTVRQLREASESMQIQVFLATQNSVFTHVIKEAKPTYFASLKDQDYLEPQLLAKAGMVSSWCIPVYINNQVVGIINTATDQHYDHGEKLKNILSTIGSISFAMDFVIGKNLVPSPAAGITARLIELML